MGLNETLDQLLGLIVAMIVYAIIRWIQSRFPDPPGVASRRRRQDDDEKESDG